MLLDAVALQQHLTSSLRLSLSAAPPRARRRRRPADEPAAAAAAAVDEGAAAAVPGEPSWDVDGWTCEVCTLLNSESAPPELTVAMLHKSIAAMLDEEF